MDNNDDGNAAMIMEVMSALFVGLGCSEDVAALTWKGMRTVYPRGNGMGYSHLGGVVEGLRR